jgi:hypothetical protein
MYRPFVYPNLSCPNLSISASVDELNLAHIGSECNNYFQTIFRVVTKVTLPLHRRRLLPYHACMKTLTKKATKNAKAGRKPPVKLKKTDKDFYAKIGAMGGKRTLALRGKGHFTKAARLSHAPGVRPVRAPQPDPDSPCYPSERVGQDARRGRRKASASD